MISKQIIEWLGILTFATVVVVLPAPATAQGEREQAPITIRLPYDFAATLALFTDAINQFSKEIESRTGGKVKIVQYANGTLYKGPEALRVLPTGGVEMAAINSAQTTDLIPESVILRLPFLIEGEDNPAKVFKPRSNFITEMNKLAQKKGIRILGYLSSGPLIIFSKSKPLNSIDDLKGLKVRTSGGGIQDDVFKALGTFPISLSPSELTTGLEQGSVDAAQGTYSFWLTSFSDIGKQSIHLGNMLQAGYFIIASEQFWAKLTPQTQNIIVSAVDNAVENQVALSLKLAKSDEEKLNARGAKTYHPSPAEYAKWAEMTKSVWKKYPMPEALAAAVKRDMTSK